MTHLTEKDRLYINAVANANNLKITVGLSENDNIYISSKDKKHEGMQVIYSGGIYEVSQYMAGKNQNELHVYTETNSLNVALKSLIIGNKNRRILKRW